MRDAVSRNFRHFLLGIVVVVVVNDVAKHVVVVVVDVFAEDGESVAHFIAEGGNAARLWALGFAPLNSADYARS